MTNLVRIDYTVNGKTECYWLSSGTLDEIDALKKKLETTIQEDRMWSTECPMKGRGCQCSAREKCIHNK